MRVVVGRIGKAHGIRGEVTVEVRTDEPERRFAPGSRLLVQDPRGGEPVVDSLTVDTMRPHGGGLLIGFEGFDDRTGAESLRGIVLEVDRDPGEQPLERDEYYDSDLVGCVVRDRQGADLGVVTDVVHLPAQDLLAVCDARGREWLLPLVHTLVPDIDPIEKVIIATPPDGLIDPETGE